MYFIWKKIIVLSNYLKWHMLAACTHDTAWLRTSKGHFLRMCGIQICMVSRSTLTYDLFNIKGIIIDCLQRTWLFGMVKMDLLFSKGKNRCDQFLLRLIIPPSQPMISGIPYFTTFVDGSSQLHKGCSNVVSLNGCPPTPLLFINSI